MQDKFEYMFVQVFESGSEGTTHCRGVGCDVLRAVCRKDLNNPPTAVGGIRCLAGGV